jgi:hypothetical protein
MQLKNNFTIDVMELENMHDIFFDLFYREASSPSIYNVYNCLKRIVSNNNNTFYLKLINRI